METKMKGIYKGFKFITRIFVVKEREMEIGYPTDVKHVAHIGWDSHSANAPSWMNEFKNGSDFSTTSLSNLCETSNHSTWSSQDFEQSVGGCLPASALFRNCSASDHPKVPKKHKRKKIKSTTSSPKSSSSSSKSSRALKSKATTYTGMVAEVEKHQ